MTDRVGLEVDTLTIRIPMRLQRRGGRKLIMRSSIHRYPDRSSCPTRLWIGSRLASSTIGARRSKAAT
jgi:hypothetical protein